MDVNYVVTQVTGIYCVKYHMQTDIYTTNTTNRHLWAVITDVVGLIASHWFHVSQNRNCSCFQSYEKVKFSKRFTVSIIITVKSNNITDCGQKILQNICFTMRHFKFGL